jgi:hypothetical protein
MASGSYPSFSRYATVSSEMYGPAPAPAHASRRRVRRLPLSQGRDRRAALPFVVPLPLHLPYGLRQHAPSRMCIIAGGPLLSLLIPACRVGSLSSIPLREPDVPFRQPATDELAPIPWTHAGQTTAVWWCRSS